jgi:uncharacterized protein DUF4352
MTHARFPGRDDDRHFAPSGPLPGHGAAAPQPTMPAPAAKPPKKKWPWIVGGVVLLVLVICGGLGAATLFAGGKAIDNGLKELEADQKGVNAVAGTVGKPTTDGNFEFTAHSIKCGVSSLGDGAIKAQGQFCLVKITVKNVGKESDFYDGSSQKAYDKSNTEYSHDAGAAALANEDSSTFLETINPGNKTDGTLVFDVPADTKITSVVLHDSFTSKGVRFTF